MGIEMDKWEYRMFNVYHGEEMTLLADKGAEGWEAFSLDEYRFPAGVLPGHRPMMHIYCKRKI